MRTAPRNGIGLWRDRRGIAAVEFALIAPALLVVFLGVIEMSFRFRAAEETTRFTQEVADLVSRQETFSTSALEDLYDASVYMMKPLEATDRLDLDVVSVGYANDADATPSVFWRRSLGVPVDVDLDESRGLGGKNESVIRVAVRYRYDSPFTTLFRGPTVNIRRVAYARPRLTRLITMDGAVQE